MNYIKQVCPQPRTKTPDLSALLSVSFDHNLERFLLLIIAAMTLTGLSFVWPDFILFLCVLLFDLGVLFVLARERTVLFPHNWVSIFHPPRPSSRGTGNVAVAYGFDVSYTPGMIGSSAFPLPLGIRKGKRKIGV